MLEVFFPNEKINSSDMLDSLSTQFITQAYWYYNCLNADEHTSLSETIMHSNGELYIQMNGQAVIYRATAWYLPVPKITFLNPKIIQVVNAVRCSLLLVRAGQRSPTTTTTTAGRSPNTNAITIRFTTVTWIVEGMVIIIFVVDIAKLVVFIFFGIFCTFSVAMGKNKVIYSGLTVFWVFIVNVL